MVANNSSLANLPIDINNPTSLKRYLTRIALAIDVIIGIKGDNAISVASDASLMSLAAAFNSVDTQLSDINKQLNVIAVAQAELSRRVTTLENQP